MGGCWNAAMTLASIIWEGEGRVGAEDEVSRAICAFAKMASGSKKMRVTVSMRMRTQDEDEGEHENER